MTTLNGIPYAGPVQISLDNCKEQLIDLPPAARRRLRKAQKGIDGVRKELEQTIPVHGDAAGITPTMHEQFVTNTELIEKLQAHKLVLAKALEVVNETLAKAEHERENNVSQMVDRVKSTAQRTGNPDLLAPFQKTLYYNAQSALKAVASRRKNGKGKPVKEPKP